MGSAGTTFFPLLRAKDAKAIVAHMAAKPNAERMAQLEAKMPWLRPADRDNLNNRDIRVANWWSVPPDKAEARRALAARNDAWAKAYKAAPLAKLVDRAAKTAPFAARAAATKPRAPLWVLYMGEGNVNSMSSGANDDYSEWRWMLDRAKKDAAAMTPRPKFAVLLANGNRRASDDALPPAKFDVVPLSKFAANPVGKELIDRRQRPLPIKHTTLREKKQ